MNTNTLKVFALGVRDGWQQPTDLCWSYNVDHLEMEKGHDVHDTLDRGINVGQFARAGFRSQSWREGFWPFSWNGKASA